MVDKKALIGLSLVVVGSLLMGSSERAFAQNPSGRPSDRRRPPRRTQPPKPAEPQVSTVILTILSTPPEAAVYLNGDKRGVTNAEGKISFEKLPYGHYSVEVRKEGYHPMLKGFEAGSESPTLVFKLEPDLTDFLKEFDSLTAAGKLTGPETPNAMELIDRLSRTFPGRPEIDRLRAVLLTRFTEAVEPVITRTISDWRGLTRPEIVKATDSAINAVELNKEDVKYQAQAAYLRGVLALRDWQTAGRVSRSVAGGEGDLLAAARMEFEKALGLQPSFAAAQYQLGSVLLAMSDGAGAEAAFLKATQLEPQWILARLGLGEAYLAQRKFREAIDAYRKAMEIDSKSAAALAGLGFARWSKGEKDGLKDLERSVQLDPSCAVAHLNLGLVYSQSKKKKDWQKAEAQLKTAIELNPDHIFFPNSVAEQRIAELKKKR
jgi:Flp pilus assembly protein TadD